nr:hypothetical protein [Tanacetum cinerariifolium]
MTHGTLSSRLVPNPILQPPYVPPAKNDWDNLFQLMFDKFFNPSPSVVSPVPVAAAPRYNFKEAMLESSWVDAMQEEIHELEPLQVWDLVRCPDFMQVYRHNLTSQRKLNFSAAVVRTQAQHREAIRGMHEQLLGVRIQEELTALRFRVDIAEAENASLRARIKTTEATEKITRKKGLVWRWSDSWLQFRFHSDRTK